MKKIATLIGLTFALTLARPAECQTKKALLLGDSLAEGMSRCFSLLATATGHRKESAFLRGSTTEHWAKRIEKIMGDSAPDLVIVSLGTNDAAGHDTIEKKRQRVQRIVGAIKRRRAKVVWILPPELPASFSGQADVRKVLREELSPGELFETDRVTLRRAEDGIHMTSLGYSEWMREVWSRLEADGLLSEPQPVEITVGSSTSLPLTSGTPGCLTKSKGP